MKTINTTDVQLPTSFGYFGGLTVNRLTATEKREETINNSVQLNKLKQRKTYSAEKSYIPISSLLTILNQ